MTHPFCRRPSVVPAACCTLLAAAIVTLPAHALEAKPQLVYVAGGAAPHETAIATVGLGWDTAWRRAWLGGELGATVEVFASQWRARSLAGGRESYTQLGVLPLLRYRFGEGGRSRWFLEAGIGATVMDAVYHTPDKQFSTSGNFYDVLGGGLNLGRDGRHEIGLRYAHVSNAGIRKPNPGENSLLLRYAIRF